VRTKILFLIITVTAVLGGIIFFVNFKKTISPTTNINQPTSTPEIKEGYISGKIIVTYNIPEFPNIKDNITIDISKNEGGETFGAALCKAEKDDCIWFISQDSKTITYGYKLTMDGDTDTIKNGVKYNLNVYIFTYKNTSLPSDNKSGELLAQGRDEKVVQVPPSGILTQDFNVIPKSFTN
jgi:hypothetical protein